MPSAAACSPAPPSPARFDGPNNVFAFRSVDDYPGISYINNRRPGELYIVGGEYPTKDDPRMVGPYIAKADATTGKQIWRTYLDNLNVSGRWIGNANLNILPDGNIAFAWSHFIALVDGDTGEILKTNTLPAGDAPIEDVNFKHLTIAPDGTLILKDQTRPIGCTLQGTMAIIDCSQQGMKSPNSVLVAVDPEDAGSARLAAVAGTRPLAAYRRAIRRQDRDLRPRWRHPRRATSGIPKPKKLSADASWVVHPLVEGQARADGADRRRRLDRRPDQRPVQQQEGVERRGHPQGRRQPNVTRSFRSANLAARDSASRRPRTAPIPKTT